MHTSHISIKNGLFSWRQHVRTRNLGAAVWTSFD